MEKNLIETSLGNQEVFSRNLLRYMRLAGITQADMARRAKVSTGTVNDWVKGRCYPKMDKIQLLASILNIQKSDLIEDGPLKEPIIITEEDQEVLDLFHQVAEDKREFVLSIIRSAINNL